MYTLSSPTLSHPNQHHHLCLVLLFHLPHQQHKAYHAAHGCKTNPIYTQQNVDSSDLPVRSTTNSDQLTTRPSRPAPTVCSLPFHPITLVLLCCSSPIMHSAASHLLISPKPPPSPYPPNHQSYFHISLITTNTPQKDRRSPSSIKLSRPIKTSPITPFRTYRPRFSAGNGGASISGNFFYANMQRTCTTGQRYMGRA